MKSSPTRRRICPRSGAPLAPSALAISIVIGVSPGAAYGAAKRWPPERFAETANALAGELDASVAIFGSKAERPLCASVAEAIHAPVKNLAGETSLGEFIELAAACRVY